MSNVEHYFENLLLYGEDVKGNPNKKALSKEVRSAVEECVNYIKYSYCPECKKGQSWTYGEDMGF